MSMTHEDEEFNRIEMESRIRQESVRATRDVKPTRPQNCGTGYCSCIECVMRPEQEPVAWRAPNWGHGDDEWVYRDFDDPVLIAGGKPSPNNEALYTTPPQRTWVELSDQELVDIRKRVQEYTPIDSVKYGEAIQRAMNSALKEKNA